MTKNFYLNDSISIEDLIGDYSKCEICNYENNTCLECNSSDNFSIFIEDAHVLSDIFEISFKGVLKVFESYQEGSISYDEENIFNFVSKTLITARKYKRDLKEVISLIKTYSLITGCEEDISNLENAVSETLKSLKNNKKELSDSIYLIFTYFDETSYLNGIEDLMKATCDTLEYMKNNNKNINETVEEISKIQKNMNKYLKSKYKNKISQIKKDNFGINKFIMIIEEKYSFLKERFKGYNPIQISEYLIKNI